MSVALGVLALALLGADGAPKPAAPWINYEFRVLEMTGVDWREGVYASLQPVVRQGTATIWTTSDAVAATFVKKADKLVMAPKVAALAGSPAHFSTKVARTLVTDLSREVDGLNSRAMRVSYTPESERIRDGLATTVTGRKLDQGILVSLVLDDTHVNAVHAIYVTNSQEETKSGDQKQARWELEIPELSRSELAGEWLIPENGVLLASLGAYSVADARGKAVVHERLVLVKAAVSAPFSTGVITRSGDILFKPVKPVMAAPSAPSRTLPQGLNAEGEPVPLPPLPPEAPAPTARPDSAEPVATPQSKHSPASEPKAEDEAGSQATDENPAPPPEDNGKPATEPEIKKTSLPVDDPRYAPLGPDMPWPDSQAAKRARMGANGLELGGTVCCEVPQPRAARTPDPLPEASITTRSPEEELAQREQRRQRIVALIQALERQRLTGEDSEGFQRLDESIQHWEQFWNAYFASDSSRSHDHQDGAEAPPPPVQSYEFRLPLSGADLELRIVPRRGAEPNTRATWRPSGQADSAKK